MSAVVTTPGGWRIEAADMEHTLPWGKTIARREYRVSRNGTVEVFFDLAAVARHIGPGELEET